MVDASHLICELFTRMTRQLDHIKQQLKAKNWRQQDAALQLGVTFEHLNRVLNGHRESKRLLARISQLPKRTPVSAA